MLNTQMKVNKEYELTEQMLQLNDSNNILLDNLNFIGANKVRFKLIKFCSMYQFELELLYFKGDVLVAKQTITEYLSNHFPLFVKVVTPKQDKGNLIGYIANHSVYERSTIIVEDESLVTDEEPLTNLQRRTSFKLSNHRPTLKNYYYLENEKIMNEENIPYKETIHLTNYDYIIDLYNLTKNM